MVTNVNNKIITNKVMLTFVLTYLQVPQLKVEFLQTQSKLQPNEIQ